jgi:DNA repair protein RecN (Recombination protein N)
MGHIASELSNKRKQAVESLEQKVKQELGDLAMEQIEFDIKIEQAASDNGMPFPDGESYTYTADGADEVEFMVSTNPGEPMKPLSKIASTGETSRFMLALKGALAQADDIPVLIFDEIDIGVGGRSGDTIGKKLWLLSRGRQVICVTHLPQIAVFADAQYRVQKEVSGSRTTSILQALSGEDQTEEIAAMVGGANYTNTSLDTAQELMKKAHSWKDGVS